MSEARVYLPLDVEALEQLADSGELAASGRMAYAVTVGLGRGDSEELEHRAWSAAVEASGEGLDRELVRRVVAAADVETPSVHDAQDAGEPARVQVDGVLPLRAVASFHVDEAPGGEDADLLWHDVTELDAVLALVRSVD